VITEVSYLREALKKVGVVIPRRATFPICQSVLLEGKDNVLTIKATNLESAVIVTLPYTGEGIYSCIPYRVFYKFLSTGEGKVSIVLSGRNLIIDRVSVGKLNMVVSDTKDFPAIPFKENLSWSKLDAKEICRLFNIAVIGCAVDESRPVLTSICCRDGEIASADGFRLYNIKSEKFTFGIEESVNSGFSKPNNKLIPRNGILKIIKLFAKKEEVQVAFDGSQVFFKTDDTCFVSQLVQGAYPKYEQLIPTQFTSKVAFSVPLMLQRLNLIDYSDSSGMLRMVFGRPEGTEVCSLSSRNENEAGSINYEMALPCKIEAIGVGKIAAQYNYVIDAIKPFSLCRMELSDTSSPMKITGDIEGLTVVVMPMFVQW
jgi:DNA polymerase-3 subunit beta